MRPSPGRSPRARRAEAGSAYLFVLLALLVLTALGLSLVAITQTESQIGGAVKGASRVLYGAEAGMRIQFAQSRFARAGARRYMLENSTIAGTTVKIQEPVDTSAFYPIYSGPCNICSVNWGEERFNAVNYVVNAESRRYGLVGAVETPLASKRLSEMFFVQPEKNFGGRVDESIRTYNPQATEDPTEVGLEVIKY